MKIYKTMVGDDKGKLHKVDTIQYNGGLWLVPVWLEIPEEKLTKPAFMIRIDQLPLQNTLGGPFGDYILAQGHIPIDVLEGKADNNSEHKFDIVRNPDIQFSGGSA